MDRPAPPEEPGLVMVTGISAAGKSTVADLLARRFARGVHVKGDVFRRMVVSGRDEMRPSPSEEALRQLRLRYRLGAAVSDGYAAAGFGVVWQDVILGDLLPEAAGMVRTRPLVVVVLCPSPAAVEAREAGRAKTAYGPGRYTAAELDRDLRSGTPRIGLWLDSSDQSPDDTVNEILRRGWTEGRYDPPSRRDGPNPNVRPARPIG